MQFCYNYIHFKMFLFLIWPKLNFLPNGVFKIKFMSILVIMGIIHLAAILVLNASWAGGGASIPIQRVRIKPIGV